MIADRPWYQSAWGKLFHSKNLYKVPYLSVIKPWDTLNRSSRDWKDQRILWSEIFENPKSMMIVLNEKPLLLIIAIQW